VPGRITLITGNDGKAREYAALLGIEIAAVSADLIEVQALDVATVAEAKARDALARFGGPVLVDDTGLSLAAWNGLPGALVAWFLQTVGADGILAMAAGLDDRRATVTTALGYADAGGVRVFQGTLHGTLTRNRRGAGGFGYDSIFIPDGHDRTFAEMTPEEKNCVSHRRLAADAMREATGLA
jgi:non-canonical purine NTP pyrophosphatase (RdgB/HAM1 family)